MDTMYSASFDPYMRAGKSSHCPLRPGLSKAHYPCIYRPVRRFSSLNCSRHYLDLVVYMAYAMRGPVYYFASSIAGLLRGHELSFLSAVQTGMIEWHCCERHKPYLLAAGKSSTHTLRCGPVELLKSFHRFLATK